MLHGLDIDTKATASNVRRFLTHDLSRYLSLAGAQRTNLKSPLISGMPKAAPAGNATEDHFLDVVTAERVVNCVKLAIAGCTLVSKQILTYRYLDGQEDWQVAKRLDYSYSRYKDLKRFALCEFAGRYRHQTMKAELETQDLNVYK